MGLLDKEIGRRKLIIEAGKKAPIIFVGAGASFELACSLLEKSNTATDPNLITEKNLENLLEYLPNPADFSIIEVSHLEQVEKDFNEDDLPKLGVENSQFLTKHGIESFSVAQDFREDKFLVSISFLPDTKPGKLLDGSGSTWWPAFLLLGDGQVFKLETVGNFELLKHKKDSPNIIGNFYFPIKRDEIVGKGVIIILNGQLINVAGQDLPPFALPFLVQIESPCPFA